MQKSEIVSQIPTPKQTHQPLHKLNFAPFVIEPSSAKGQVLHAKWWDQAKKLLLFGYDPEMENVTPEDALSDEEDIIVTGHTIGDLKVMKRQE